jgi:AcrR family transcriptional regulator
VTEQPPKDTASRILDAALTEFAERGFDGTSTAAIAERAGVAKALVFHHFGSKDALFLAVAEHTIERARLEYDRVMAEAPPDLLARVLAWTERKFAMFREDPRQLRFLMVSLVHAPKPLRDDVRRIHQSLASRDAHKLVEGMDASRLRVSPQEALDALETVVLGIEQRFYALPLGARTSAQVEQFASEAKKLLSLLARALYRESPAKKSAPKAKG